MPKTRHIPERKCVACGQRTAKRSLTRIVRTNGGRGAGGCHRQGQRPGRLSLPPPPPAGSAASAAAGLERSLKTAIPGRERQLLLDYYREQVAGPTLLEQ